MNTYPKEIKLYNRYRENVYLKHIVDNKYELITPDPYMRFGIKDDDLSNYTFVDPSGGPFISEDGVVEEYKTNNQYKVEKIYSEKKENNEYRIVIILQLN